MTSRSHPLLTSTQASRKEPGHWLATIPRSWWAWSGPLGGLLSALAVHAAADLVEPGVAPRATDTQFLRKPADAPISFVATLERAGRSSQFVSVRATQHDETFLLASVVFARGQAGQAQQRVEAPAVPLPEACQEIEFPADLVPFGQQFTIRHADGGFPMSGSSRAEMAAWLRLRPAVPVDPLIALVMTDVMPPGLYPVLNRPTAIVSAHLSVHLHVDLSERPVDDDVLVVQRNVTSGGGWCTDEADMWDRTGLLLAQARQLRRGDGSTPQIPSTPLSPDGRAG